LDRYAPLAGLVGERQSCGTPSALRWLLIAAINLFRIERGCRSTADVKPRQVIAEFEVPDDDPIRVRRHRPKEYTFLINTGLVTSTIDESKATELHKIRLRSVGSAEGRSEGSFGSSPRWEHPSNFPAASIHDYTTAQLDLECDGETRRRPAAVHRTDRLRPGCGS
jgi:hypothetical protein